MLGFLGYGDHPGGPLPPQAHAAGLGAQHATVDVDAWTREFDLHWPARMLLARAADIAEAAERE